MRPREHGFEIGSGHNAIKGRKGRQYFLQSPPRLVLIARKLALSGKPERGEDPEQRLHPARGRATVRLPLADEIAERRDAQRKQGCMRVALRVVLHGLHVEFDLAGPSEPCIEAGATVALALGVAQIR